MNQTVEQVGQGAREMPRYRSHKTVWALKIKAIELRNATIGELEEILRDGRSANEFSGGAAITPEEEGFAVFLVTREYLLKHNPQVGGYYVVYADGYKSWSPAQAFDEGYTRV
jgi:hypothetical protein